MDGKGMDLFLYTIESQKSLLLPTFKTKVETIWNRFAIYPFLICIVTPISSTNCDSFQWRLIHSLELTNGKSTWKKAEGTKRKLQVIIPTIHFQWILLIGQKSQGQPFGM